MINTSLIRKSLYSALVFFGTIMVLSIGYATWNSSMGKVSIGSTLSASGWNALVDNIEDLDSRWSRNGAAIVYTGGNVGIGTTAPSYKLEINVGDIDYTTSKLEGLVVRANSYNDSIGIRNQGVALQTGWAGIGFNRIWNNGNYSIGKGYSSLIQQDPTGNNVAWLVFDNATTDGQNISGRTGLSIQNTTGYVGIGTISPVEKLDLGGGNVKMGYEMVQDTRTITTNTTYYVSCPTGKYILSGTARTVGGWMEVAHDFEATRMLVLADHNQFPSQVESGIISKIICANIR